MQQVSVINMYLQKVAAGDDSCADKLCKRLADRLLHVPIFEQKGENASMKIQVMRIREGERVLIPAFTSDTLFKMWATNIGHPGKSIALLGADFTAALEPNTWLYVDPGTEHAAELKPELVKKISESGSADGEAHEEEEAELQAAEAAPAIADPDIAAPEKQAQTVSAGSIIKLDKPLAIPSQKAEFVKPEQVEEKKTEPTPQRATATGTPQPEVFKPVHEAAAKQAPQPDAQQKDARVDSAARIRVHTSTKLKTWDDVEKKEGGWDKLRETPPIDGHVSLAEKSKALNDAIGDDDDEESWIRSGVNLRGPVTGASKNPPTGVKRKRGLLSFFTADDE